MHHDEGFLVDLGGLAAASNPLHVPVSGPAANALTRGYHLSVMSGNRLRILADWALNVATPTEMTSFGVISAESVLLDVNKPRMTRPKSVPATHQPLHTCSVILKPAG